MNFNALANSVQQDDNLLTLMRKIMSLTFCSAFEAPDASTAEAQEIGHKLESTQIRKPKIDAKIVFKMSK
jgi:hypothetical protein